MNRKNIEEVMESLDGCQSAAAPDFFYTRLRARLDKGQELSQASWLLKPAFVIGAVMLILVLNVLVLWQGNNKNDNIASSSSDDIQAIASDYSIADNNYQFDYTLEK